MGFTVDTAIIFNTKSGFSAEMTAKEYELRYRGDPISGMPPTHPTPKEDLEAFSKKDALPLTFRKTHRRGGDEEIVKACWVRPAGFDDQDHVFGGKKSQTLNRALNAGKTILLSLNLKLTPDMMDFENMQEKGASNLREWITSQKGNYISVSVHSAQEAIDIIKKVHEHAPDKPMDQMVFALHRGAVVPYHNFYLGTREKALTTLYRNLQNNQSGVPFGETRMIGFPRLFRFTPTESTIGEHGTKGLKGNRINQETGKPIFSTLVFSNREDALASDPYRILSDDLTHNKAGAYVLAVPMVTIAAPSDNWKQIRWAIYDTSNQTAQLSPETREKISQYSRGSPQP